MASFSFHIDGQTDLLSIEGDGRVLLERTFAFSVDAAATENGTEIWAGLPTRGTTVSEVVDEAGQPVPFKTTFRDGQFLVILSGFAPIRPGGSARFTVRASIPEFLFQDTRDSSYATMTYIPGWWDAPVGSQDVNVVAPPGADRQSLRSGSGGEWDEAGQSGDGRQVLKWRFGQLVAGQRVAVTLGFPSRLVSGPITPAGGAQGPETGRSPLPGPTSPAPSAATGSLVTPLLILGFLAILILSAINRRGQYTEPEVGMDGVGVLKSLDPVEAAVLLRADPSKVLTLILFRLCRRGAIRVVGPDPLRLEVLRQPESGDPPYERDFLKSVKASDGAVDQEALLAGYRRLVELVVEKSRPYCRRDTEAFYRDRVEQAWQEMERAETPELKVKAWDDHLGWYFLDPEAPSRVERNLGPVAHYFPVDYWLWASLYHPFGLPGPAGTAGWLGPGLGSLEGRLAHGLVPDEQPFRHSQEAAWQPERPTVGHHPPSHPHWTGGVGGAGSCACACACVSCACACACAGGGGCT